MMVIRYSLHPPSNGFKFCPKCERFYRLTGQNGPGSGPGARQGDIWCWPCSDAHFDSQWGPSDDQFEYVVVTTPQAIEEELATLRSGLEQEGRPHMRELWISQIRKYEDILSSLQ